MNVLVLCGDIWHPAEVIRRGLKSLEGEFVFDFVEDAHDILTPELLKEYPVIINAKSNYLSEANEAAWLDDDIGEVGSKELREYVEAGGGFLALHAGNSFRKDVAPGYTDFVGNSFVRHPPRCPVQVCVTDTGHPITLDVADFQIRDEHYMLEELAADRWEFLRSTSAEGGNQSAGYTRNVGNGRVCALMPGHILSVFQNPQYLKVLRNAIYWCAGKNKNTREDTKIKVVLKEYPHLLEKVEKCPYRNG